MTTKTLSDKKIYMEGQGWVLPGDDVKEFIQALKERLCLCGGINTPCHNCAIIKQLAGDKLV